LSIPALAAVACLATLVYLYVGYPAFLQVLALVRPRPVLRDTVTPSVTVLVPAHNEVAVIEEKVRNTLASDYPPERLEVLVISDGSTDGTVERVRRIAADLRKAWTLGPGGDRARPPRVRVLDLPRMGKGRALNEGAAAANGEILVFTDANVSLLPDALRELVANFADPRVGAVCGDKRYRSGRAAAGGGTARGEGLYWRYDRWVKRLESRVGSAFASDGALHAVRWELYRPIRNPASADDMAISMPVVLQGYRLVYEPRARVVEAAPHDPAGEFRRKIRVTNHSMRALLDLGPALWGSGFYSVQLLSHKFLRHLSPLFLAGVLGGSALGARTGDPWMELLFAAQLLFYALAIGGYLLRRSEAGSRTTLAAPYHFALIQLAALAGIASLVQGRRPVTWTPRGGLEAG
jgi:cellulose synthase/poly-beta-1,6-N-acetylglucosamine synthase-like glycosyltransferase